VKQKLSKTKGQCKLFGYTFAAIDVHSRRSPVFPSISGLEV